MSKQESKEVLNTYGFYNAVQLSWPLDLDQLPERKVNGPTRIFIHNAGLVDNDDRKETRSVIKAFSRGKRTRIETYPSYSEAGIYD